MEPVETSTRWHDEWKSAIVVNSFLVLDPAVPQPGFDLPRRQCSLLNRFRTAEGQCRACLKKWGQADSDLCDCRVTQTMFPIVDACPLTKLEGGLHSWALHEAGPAAVQWLKKM